MQRTTDKYNKVQKRSEAAPENEVRIRAAALIGRYIGYAASLLLEKKLDTVIIKASGNAAKNACQVAEILRHRIKGLHQMTRLSTVSVVDEYEPREQGLENVKVDRRLAVLEITLSLKASALDTKAPGYQAPLPDDQVQEEDMRALIDGRRGRGGRGGGRGRGFGGRGGFRDDDRDRGFGGDRDFGGDRGYGGRGRGFGGRGRGRGGYGGDRDYEDRGYGGGRDYEDRGYGGGRGYGGRGRGFGGRGGFRDDDREDRDFGGRGRGRGFGGRGGPGGRGGRGGY